MKQMKLTHKNSFCDDKKIKIKRVDKDSKIDDEDNYKSKKSESSSSEEKERIQIKKGKKFSEKEVNTDAIGVRTSGYINTYNHHSEMNPKIQTSKN